MSCMFRFAATFNQRLGAWDTSKVTDISSMFSGASTFNQPLEGLDTSKVCFLERLPSTLPTSLWVPGMRCGVDES